MARLARSRLRRRWRSQDRYRRRGDRRQRPPSGWIFGRQTSGHYARLLSALWLCTMRMMFRVIPIGSVLAALCLLSGAGVHAGAQGEDKEKKEPKRPSLSLKAAPGTGMVPVRVSATAEFKGGDDDFQEYYCPSIEWS